MARDFDYDWLVIGSGFGGSVSALRLAEKGYRVLVLSGAGVGGGSLIYANTLLEPGEEAFRRGTWPRGVDWKRVLAPHYATARRILGVTTTPRIWEGDRQLFEFAKSLGKEDTFRPTEVAVLFARPGEREG